MNCAYTPQNKDWNRRCTRRSSLPISWKEPTSDASMSWWHQRKNSGSTRANQEQSWTSTNIGSALWIFDGRRRLAGCGEYRRSDLAT